MFTIILFTQKQRIRILETRHGANSLALIEVTVTKKTDSVYKSINSRI